jgi:hypothetical protein
VEIDYACSADNIGSTIEMSFGDSKLAGTVSMPHDPPLRGAEHDRYPRNGESLVKDFKPMKLGEMPLSKGHGLLTLRATQMTGKEVMEVRGLVLTLLE